MNLDVFGSKRSVVEEDAGCEGCPEMAKPIPGCLVVLLRFSSELGIGRETDRFNDCRRWSEGPGDCEGDIGLTGLKDRGP
jgi:hypothetical protein